LPTSMLGQQRNAASAANALGLIQVAPETLTGR
jgi:hypothetical protein